MQGKILRWGNSYGVRLSKPEVERRGLRAGETVDVEIRAEPRRKVDLSWLPHFEGLGELARHHDDVDWS